MTNVFEGWGYDNDTYFTSLNTQRNAVYSKAASAVYTKSERETFFSSDYGTTPQIDRIVGLHNDKPIVYGGCGTVGGEGNGNGGENTGNGEEGSENDTTATQQEQASEIYFGGTYYKEGETQKISFNGILGALDTYRNSLNLDGGILYTDEGCTSLLDAGTVDTIGSKFMDWNGEEWVSVPLYGKKTTETVTTDEETGENETTTNTEILTITPEEIHNVIDGYDGALRKTKFYTGPAQA